MPLHGPWARPNGRESAQAPAGAPASLPREVGELSARAANWRPRLDSPKDALLDSGDALDLAGGDALS